MKFPTKRLSEEKRAANVDSANRILARWEALPESLLIKRGRTGLWKRGLERLIVGTLPAATDRQTFSDQLEEYKELLARHEALKETAEKAPAFESADEFMGWSVVLLGLLGLLGLLATVWLVNDVASKDVSPFLWRALVDLHPKTVGTVVCTTAVYLLSYFLIFGIASTVIYNYFDQRFGGAVLLICSGWILCTVVILARPMIVFVTTLAKSVPSNPWEWLFVLVWAAWGWLSFQLFDLENGRRKSRRR